MSNKGLKKDAYVVELTDSLQKLSFDQLLQELGKMKLKLGVIIPTIFKKGKESGYTEIEIRNKIKKIIDVPERTLNPYLPENAKRHIYPKKRELANSANYNEIIEDSTSTKPGDLTLEELVSRHEEIQLENVYLDMQLADANTRIEELEQSIADGNTRIEELEQSLEEQGLMVYNKADDNDK